MQDIRLVCFDLGRVLVRICDSWDHACQVARLPIKLPPRDEARRAALLEPVIGMETGRIDTEAFCHQAARVLDVEPHHIRSILDVFLIEPYPGVRELLDELHARGYATACLSNTQTEHWNQMLDSSNRAALPLNRLTHRFASHLVGLRKPDEAIYAHVEQAARFRGEQIVFFDDTLINVEAARRRGWHAWQITPDCDPVTQIREFLSTVDVLPVRLAAD